MTQINDCKLAYYQANGATSDDIQDAEREFLIAAGGTPGTNQDMWVELFGPGAYTDIRHQFWIDAGCQPGAVVPPPALGPELIPDPNFLDDASEGVPSTTWTTNDGGGVSFVAGGICELGPVGSVTLNEPVRPTLDPLKTYRVRVTVEAATTYTDNTTIRLGGDNVGGHLTSDSVFEGTVTGSQVGPTTEPFDMSLSLFEAGTKLVISEWSLKEVL